MELGKLPSHKLYLKYLSNTYTINIKITTCVNCASEKCNNEVSLINFQHLFIFRLFFVYSANLGNSLLLKISCVVYTVAIVQNFDGGNV